MFTLEIKSFTEYKMKKIQANALQTTTFVYKQIGYK